LSDQPELQRKNLARRLFQRRQRAQNRRMPAVISRSLLGAVVLSALAAMATARADEVTVYRCVAPAGAIAFQDHPCPKDSLQQVRQMMRPRHAPPRPEPIAVSQPVQRPPQPRAPRDPQPLYQCTTPNGDSYVSQSGTPQGSYAPLWTMGYGDYSASGRPAGNGARGRSQRTNGPRQFRGGATGQAGLDPYGPVTYVQDTCVRMQQRDVCQSLRDRDSALGTQIFNAQPDDREVYEREQKSVENQLQNDCSGT
jgi:hypothetical protein